MKLSIIVPVYQVEKYIRPCMESIFRQGLDETDFEVIIVNDGTKDRSMEVIADIISQHDNITVINQENLSLSVARNNGIAVAQGEYIIMPDSDDLLIDNSLPTLLDLALRSKADLVVADFLKMTDKEISTFDKKNFNQPKFQYIEKTGEQLFLEDLNPYQCYIWRTLYRREFLTSLNITFYPDIRYQDIPFTHECYLKAGKCMKTNRVLNIYRIWPGASTKNFTPQKAQDFTIAIDKTWELRKLKGLSMDMLYKLEENVYASYSLMIYHTISCINKKSNRNNLIDFLNAQIPDLVFAHSIRQRITTFMIRSVPHLYINLYYLYAKIVYSKKQKYGKN